MKRLSIIALLLFCLSNNQAFPQEFVTDKPFTIENVPEKFDLRKQGMDNRMIPILAPGKAWLNINLTPYQQMQDELNKKTLWQDKYKKDSRFGVGYPRVTYYEVAPNNSIQMKNPTHREIYRMDYKIKDRGVMFRVEKIYIRGKMRDFYHLGVY